MTPRLLLLGGLDPSGGAGLTLDAVAAAWHGCHALPVATAGTVQDRRAFVARWAPEADRFAATLAAAIGDGEVHAVKIGMLGDAATAERVAAGLRDLAGRVPIVVDPVLVATAAGPAAPAALAAAYREHLLPIASLLLPNGPELELLFGGEVARAFAHGCGAVLCKGGHGDGATCDDVLWRREAPPLRFSRARLPTGPVRGTGCALATAIAAHLAHGADLEVACRRAGDWLHALLHTLEPARDDALPRLLPLARPIS